MKIVMSVDEIEGFDRFVMAITQPSALRSKGATKSEAISSLINEIDEAISDLQTMKKMVQDF